MPSPKPPSSSSIVSKFDPRQAKSGACMLTSQVTHHLALKKPPTPNQGIDTSPLHTRFVLDSIHGGDGLGPAVSICVKDEIYLYYDNLPALRRSLDGVTGKLENGVIKGVRHAELELMNAAFVSDTRLQWCSIFSALFSLPLAPFRP